MRRRVLLLALALSAAALAGCLGTDSGGTDGAPDADAPDGGSDGGSDDGEDDEPAGYATPRWSPGLWWSYNYSLAGETGTVTFAVQAEEDDRYTLLANGTHHAAVDVLRDLAYVGPVRAEDLAGLVDGEPVRFFEWPLRDGRTWTTTWNGIERTHDASEADLEVPGGTLPGMEITSTAGGETLATYTYAPAVGWFTRLEIPGRNLTYELTDIGFGYQRNLTQASVSPVFEETAPAATATTFQVPAEADRVAVAVDGGGDRVGYEVSLGDPNGTRHQVGPQACMDCTVDVLELLPAIPGTWSAEANLASTPPGNVTAKAGLVDAEPVAVDYGS
jgi:hypothetical protein